MKIVILINTSAFAKYYIKLGDELSNSGCDIIYAVQNEFSKELYFSNDRMNVVVCPDISKSKLDSVSLPNEFSSWMMHPDYDRGLYYGFSNEFSGANAINHIKNTYAFFSELFDEFSPDCVFYENISNGFANIAYEVCNRLDIQYIGLTSSRLPNMVYFSQFGHEIKYDIENYIKENEFSDEELTYAKEYIENISTVQPDYMKFNGLSNFSFKALFNKPMPSMHSLNVHFKYLYSAGYQTGIPIKSSLLYRLRDIKRYFNRKRIQKFYQDSVIFNDNTNYYLYPMHYHPESSTSLLAKFDNEFEVIKNTAFSLREGEVLLVKDHISATGFEDYDFYRKVSSLPNVMLLKPELNVKELIPKCQAIVTLTSTVGYESVLLNIPVLLFGSVFYEDHPLVVKVTSHHDIRKKLDSLPNLSDFTEYNRLYIAAYRRCCFHFTLDLRDKNTSQGIAELAKHIIRELE
ncbi:capsular polysaccharide export protein, LipB/KpsS family [Vibrio gallicus]|uniref:capsular polysaccharide export protein, LipB/KpsS family n=1 Tax=Vibrio gallicus TaxID=190897 RepID=UPI0021C370EA|nr:hypothetical protein [Vibrio gallicus]